MLKIITEKQSEGNYYIRLQIELRRQNNLAGFHLCAIVVAKFRAKLAAGATRVTHAGALKSQPSPHSV